MSDPHPTGPVKGPGVSSFSFCWTRFAVTPLAVGRTSRKVGRFVLVTDYHLIVTNLFSLLFGLAVSGCLAAPLRLKPGSLRARSLGN